jgi:transposase
MGRTIKIELNEQQRSQLLQGHQTGKTHVFRLRCQMVLLKAEGRKSQDIADFLGLCQQAVNNWLWRYKQLGISGLHTQSGQGRPPILQHTQDAQAVRLAVAEHRQRISQARADLEDTLGKKFSEKTLRRFLKNSVADINASASVPEKRKSQKFMIIK